MLMRHCHLEILNLNPSPRRNLIPISSASLRWPIIDDPLGLSEEESVSYARRFYKFGFALLLWLWALNCFYFWPVLRHSRSSKFRSVSCHVMANNHSGFVRQRQGRQPRLQSKRGFVKMVVKGLEVGPGLELFKGFDRI
ncbi:hypothetical protein ACFXTI_014414 [Malus domestica]